MSTGGTALNRVNKSSSGGGPPFPSGSADNGLSVDAVTGKFVLGNDTFGVLALLLSDREIPLSGFKVAFTDALSSVAISDGLIYLITSGQAPSIKFDKTITDGVMYELIPPGQYVGQKTFKMDVEAAQPNGDGTSNTPVRWGWFNTTGTEHEVWYQMEPHFTTGELIENHLIVQYPGGPQLRLSSSTLQPGIDPASSLNTWDFRADTFNLRSLQGANGVVFNMNTASGDGRMIVVTSGLQVAFEGGGANAFSVGPVVPVAGSHYFMSNWDTISLLTHNFTVNQLATQAILPTADSVYDLGVAITNRFATGYFDKLNVFTEALFADTFDNPGTTALGHIYSFGTGTPSRNVFLIQDYNSGARTANMMVKEDGKVLIGSTAVTDVPTQLLQVLGGISSGDGFLTHTSMALTNGAGALLGTLTNAPVAGPPTKWAPVDDNGTIRYMPLW